MHLHTEEPLVCPPPFSLHPPGEEVVTLLKHSVSYKIVVKQVQGVQDGGKLTVSSVHTGPDVTASALSPHLFTRTCTRHGRYPDLRNKISCCSPN